MECLSVMFCSLFVCSDSFCVRVNIGIIFVAFTLKFFPTCGTCTNPLTN